MDAMAAELGKVPPQQLEAEQSVLGGILLDSDGLPAALEVLKGDEFYRDAHRVIFRAAQDLFERNAPIDLVTVADYLAQKNLLESVGGAAYLASLAEAVPSASNIAAYARIVSDPYPTTHKRRCRSFGAWFSPVTSSAQADSTSELLRFL